MSHKLWLITLCVAAHMHGAANQIPNRSQYGPAKLRFLAIAPTLNAVATGEITPQDASNIPPTILHPNEIAKTITLGKITPQDAFKIPSTLLHSKKIVKAVAIGIATEKIDSKTILSLNDDNQKLVLKNYWLTTQSGKWSSVPNDLDGFFGFNASDAWSRLPESLQNSFHGISVQDHIDFFDEPWERPLQGISDLTGIEQYPGRDLELFDCLITEIGDNFNQLKKLESLDLTYNPRLTQVTPQDINNLIKNTKINCLINEMVGNFGDYDNFPQPCNPLALSLKYIRSYIITTPEEIEIYNNLPENFKRYQLFSYHAGGLTYDEAIKVLKASAPRVVNQVRSHFAQAQTTSSSSTAAHSEEPTQSSNQSYQLQLSEEQTALLKWDPLDLRDDPRTTQVTPREMRSMLKRNSAIHFATQTNQYGCPRCDYHQTPALILNSKNIRPYIITTPEEIKMYNKFPACFQTGQLFLCRPDGLTRDEAIKILQASDPEIVSNVLSYFAQVQTSSSSAAASSEEQAQRGTKRTTRDDTYEPDEYAKRQETGNYSDTDSSSSLSDDETSDYASDASSSDATSSDEEFDPELSEADIEAWLD